MRNQQVIAARKPLGIPQAGDFRIVEAEVSRLLDGQFLVQNLFLSIDPSMRGWLADPNKYSLQALGRASQTVQTGEVMRSLAAAEVVESRHKDWKRGDILTGWFGWQHYAVATPEIVVERVLYRDLSPSLSLGVLGMNGVTALVGLDLLGPVRGDETLVVSTAAGSVGSVVGQIARMRGCRTVGITGGAVKRKLCLEDYGYDNALDYKDSAFAAELADALPSGANVYFDNTAGPISDAVSDHMAMHGRVIICGTAAVASWDPPPQAPRIERRLLTKRITMKGFVVFDHIERWDAAVTQLAQWVREGAVRYREDILVGLEAAPDSIAGLYRGENIGKRLIRL